MYKLLLCWRYLQTRYLALACVVSIMLGVATLIVVNSVMSGFSTKLRDRLHGLLSDVLIEATTMDGFADPAGKMKLAARKPDRRRANRADSRGGKERRNRCGGLYRLLLGVYKRVLDWGNTASGDSFEWCHS